MLNITLQLSLQVQCYKFGKFIYLQDCTLCIMLHHNWGLKMEVYLALWHALILWITLKYIADMNKLNLL